MDFSKLLWVQRVGNNRIWLSKISSWLQRLLPDRGFLFNFAQSLHVNQHILQLGYGTSASVCMKGVMEVNSTIPDEEKYSRCEGGGGRPLSSATPFCRCQQKRWQRNWKFSGRLPKLHNGYKDLVWLLNSQKCRYCSLP